MRIGLLGQSIAKRAIADLIMVLQKIDECLGRKITAGFAAMLAVAMGGSFALIDEARSEDACDLAEWLLVVVGVVAVSFSRELYVPGVVVIVVPLSPIFPAHWVGARIEQARPVVVVLQHKVDLAAQFPRARADRTAQVGEQVRLPRLGDRMHRVEPQAIEPVV